MAYRTATTPTTLSDLQGYSPTASIFKWVFFRTAVQQLTGFPVTQRVVQSLCNSSAFCNAHLWWLKSTYHNNIS